MSHNQKVRHCFKRPLSSSNWTRAGVPTLVVDEVVLIGSLEIPEQFPGLIEKYLAQGGTDWPAIPGLVELINAQATPEPTEVAAAPAIATPMATTLAVAAPAATAPAAATPVPQPNPLPCKMICWFHNPLPQMAGRTSGAIRSATGWR